MGHEFTTNIVRFWFAFLLLFSLILTESKATIIFPDILRHDNTVLKWNKAVLQFIADNRIPPPPATRLLLLVHTSINEAANSGLKQYAKDVIVLCSEGESLLLSSAAHYTLVGLYPAARAISDQIQKLLWQQQTNCSDSVKYQIQSIGESISSSVMQDRVHDGSAAFRPYVLPLNASTKETRWRPTPPKYSFSPLLPNWGEVKTYGEIGSLEDLTPPSPPDPHSAEYQVNWWKCFVLGAKHSTNRTPLQTQIAKVWEMGLGTPTPPGGWNIIAQQVAARNLRSTDVAEYSRTFWLLNLAMANAAVCCWRTKYKYAAWRPITAFRTGIAGTGLPTDPSWEPLLETPNFPEYTSGHSSFSAAAAHILATIFGSDRQEFNVTDGHITHHFHSLATAAEQAGQSRIYGGIHFDFSDTGSQTLGRKIAERVCQVHSCRLQ